MKDRDEIVSGWLRKAESDLKALDASLRPVVGSEEHRGHRRQGSIAIRRPGNPEMMSDE